MSTYDLMDTVTADMEKVNLVAIGAVFVVLLFSLRSLSLSVILVLVIETAVWVNISIPYYIYAILLTSRFRENRENMAGKEAIVETISNVTASILTSGTVLTIVGFLLGIISTHGLLSQLGYLLGRGTICSLFFVFLALPGCLYLEDCLMKKIGKKRKIK